MYLGVKESPNCNYRDYFFIDVQGLELTFTLIQNSSTDTLGEKNAPHQTIPESGFFCEVILELYDSPFRPEHFPSDAEYSQAVALTTIGVRVSNIDGPTTKTTFTNSGWGIIGLSILLLLCIAFLRRTQEN